MGLKIEWSENAEQDIRHIFKRVKKKTKSENLARNVISDIYDAGINIHYVKQYQVDEFLGEPYRRMVVRHFKIIYKPVNDDEIKILQVFDTYQNPLKLRK
ncbi:hypothetical protein A8C32_09260 [Flavivirga aquatica]|uniref:Plasmid stabilization protein n=1 Tax=Flavivirga aquatica TaxID=1849968 RepID=A0A1E5SJQ9_9FLAO|nr:type II toxin-antitoxin system RelE/ParE family toxin [Flavivirga aquatica]OEJ99341.1 hypothetical protein A8C32_09260 [Flavivirga aquatica]